MYMGCPAHAPVASSPAGMMVGRFQQVMLLEPFFLMKQWQ
jgi:hypothetical protein